MWFLKLFCFLLCSTGFNFCLIHYSTKFSRIPVYRKEAFLIGLITAAALTVVIAFHLTPDFVLEQTFWLPRRHHYYHRLAGIVWFIVLALPVWLLTQWEELEIAPALGLSLLMNLMPAILLYNL